MLVLILVNLGLTLWIVFVLDFNVVSLASRRNEPCSLATAVSNLFADCVQHGMGNLRITDSGLRMQGRAEFTDTLYAETIASEQVYIATYILVHQAL